MHDCRLSPRPRWLTVLFFRSSKPRLWADAIASAPSTCQVPLPALMVVEERAGGCVGGWSWRGGALDELLDPVPASMCQACITVHFPASPLLRCAQPSFSAGVSLQKSPATTQGQVSMLKLRMASSQLHNITTDFNNQWLWGKIVRSYCQTQGGLHHFWSLKQRFYTEKLPAL